MLLYNITAIVDDEADSRWLEQAQQKYIPAFMGTGLFASNRILKVLDSPNEGVTYSIQFVLDSTEQYNQFAEHHAGKINAEMQQEFKNQAVFFSTVMQYI